ncbi:uncharacterized protein LOC132733222 [Ruditapes philippinarum]|uniref:uncharacterized protein LOC132733222 n=1 Tax=Ruditapes philippinarum TaxID=129788 RepID=UPI00295B29F3|nr:uncharacterized protein LOC132733222 [Ruditapes philippinarum]
MWYLIRCGQENLRSMTKSTFSIGATGSGRRYIEQVIDEADKNHSGDVHPDQTIGEGKLYDWGENPNCPVRMFEKYMSKLNPKCEALRQGPLESFNENDKVWFYNAPLGKSILANLMPKISTQANLSRIYTNHCLRATAIKALDDAGVEARHIMRVSGHQSMLSIDLYAKRLSESKKEEINDILSAPFVAKPLKEPASCTTSIQKTTTSSTSKRKSLVPTATVSSVPLDDLDSIDYEDLFNKENDFSEMNQIPICTSISQVKNTASIQSGGVSENKPRHQYSI